MTVIVFLLNTMFLILLLVVTPSYIQSYSLRCPAVPQRKLRSQGLCTDLQNPEYYCLLNANNLIFEEQCRKNPEFKRPGYKFIFRGSLDGKKCDKDYYQPFKFWTNATSKCLLQKSQCTEEGQITAEDGNSITDRTCRCDYTRGYTFFKQPLKKCFCVPSLEDCSCHQTTCPSSYHFTPDYKCMRPSDITGDFKCLPIKTAIVDVLVTQKTPFLSSFVTGPDTSNIVRNHRQENMKIASTFMFLSGFLIAITMGGAMLLTKYVRHIRKIIRDEVLNQQEKELVKNGIDEKNDRNSYNSVPNEHDQQEWKKNNNKFVITEATKHIEEKLRKENCVLVIGCPGNGKTAIIQHIALKLCKEENFELIPAVSSPKNILNYYNENRKQLFIIDDFCGILVANAQQIDKWSNQIDAVLKLIKPDIDLNMSSPGHVKLLFATNENILNDKVFGNRLKQLKPFCYFLSECPLTYDEKCEIVQKYRSTVGQLKLRAEIQSGVGYFPLLCKLSEGKTADQIDMLFINSDDFIKKDIANLKDNSNMLFCIITLCVFFKNRLKANMLNDSYTFESKEEKKAFDVICAEFNLGLHREANRMRLIEKLDSSENTYVFQIKDYYCLIHSKIYQAAEIVCAQTFVDCFIKFAPCSFIATRYRFTSTNGEKQDNVVWIKEEETQTKYFKRLVNDLEKGVTYSTFHNAQLCDKEYRAKFCSHCKLKKELITKFLFQIKESNEPGPHTAQSSFDDSSDYEDYLDFTKQYHYMDHKMRMPLIESAWEGYSEIVKMLLEMKCDINETDKFGRTALFVASYRNNTGVAKELIYSGACHSLCNNKGQSPLYIASKEGNYEIVQALLEKGASTESYDIDGNSSLIVASKCGHKNVVEALLKSEADVSKCNNEGKSPLYVACVHGGTDLVNILIKHKADVNACDKEGVSPLLVVSIKGYAHLLDALIRAGAKISKLDSYGRSPLIFACEGGFDNVVDILVTKNANKMQCDQENRSPLFIACEKGHPKIVQLLIKDKPDVINLCDENDRSPLFVACEKGRFEIAKMLLKHEANINYLDNKKRSPLYAACRSGCIDVVKLLHKNGAKLHQYNIWGGSPLFVASRENHFEVVKFLIDQHSDISKADSNGKTSLIVACEEGRVKIVSYLIQKGANVNHCDKEKRSSLHAASFGGHANIVQLLIDNNADTTIRDSDGHTSLEIASKKNFQDIVEVLRKYV